MPLAADRLARLEAAISAELDATSPGLLARYPVQRAAASLAVLPMLAPYYMRPADMPAENHAWNRLLMLHLLRSSPDPGARLPGGLQALRASEIERIVAEIERPRRGFHRFGNDAFAKDLALCRGKLIAGGVELIEPVAGIGRRFVIEGGVGGVAHRLGFMLGRMGGFRNFAALHFDRRQIGEFNAEGYAMLYRRLAELLAANPAIAGVISLSWWHDPALAEISPELGFVDAVPKGAGAQVFRGRENDAATADALRFAPERIARFNEGSWRPCVHLLAWPRRDLIAWARTSV